MHSPREPNLILLHSKDTLNRVKLDHFRGLSTGDLIASLAPGREGSPKARPDGTVLDGHHRISVLMERGVDIQALPREIMEKDHES